MEFKFPKGFYWGAATSAHQVEGGNKNDWTEWEMRNAKIKAQNAKLREFPDYILKNYPNPLQVENYISGRACDHYNRFREDFDIVKSLGHNAHRFSIEWSRIEPEEGKFNEKEIEHYREVIRALRERGIEPFVTLWHWTLPIWIRDMGGWENKRTAKFFVRYAQKVASALGSETRFWLTINEPEIFVAYSYIAGIRPPQVKSLWRTAIVFLRLKSAHKKVYQIMHDVALENQVECFVGIAKHNKFFIPADTSFKNKFFTALAKFFGNSLFLFFIRQHQDFIGLNYYDKNVINFNRNAPWMGLYNLEESAKGFYHAIMDLREYDKPIYILENGTNDSIDKRRSSFIGEHIRGLAQAVKDGADVRGYFHWSLLDNFEWENGFWPRFGLVEIDYKTLERKIRPSAYEYKKIIEANAIEI